MSDPGHSAEDAIRQFGLGPSPGRPLAVEPTPRQLFLSLMSDLDQERHVGVDVIVESIEEFDAAMKRTIDAAVTATREDGT